MRSTTHADFSCIVREFVTYLRPCKDVSCFEREREREIERELDREREGLRSKIRKAI